MWKHLGNILTLAVLLPQLAFASPVPNWSSPDTSDFEVIIIGGGPAGLSALSGLARVRRRALLIDSGEYRNGATRHAHDIIGSDGVTPAYFRAAARAQIALYPTVSMQNGTITEIRKTNDTSFTVTDAAGQVYTSEKIVLATGLKDLVPSTPGVSENWSKGIFWCPWCDGYEHRDQPMGLLATIDHIPGMVEEILTLNHDIIAFVNGSMTPSALQTLDAKHPDWEQMLATYNVQIDNRTITAVERTQDGAVVASSVDKAEYDKFIIHLDDGTAVERGAFFTSFPSTQRSGLGAALGVTITDGKLYANFTGGMRTDVLGVYAVGDANSDGSTNVPHAMWSGKRAAVDIHLSMAKDEAAAAVQGTKSPRDLHLDDEESLMALLERDLEDLWVAR